MTRITIENETSHTLWRDNSEKCNLFKSGCWASTLDLVVVGMTKLDILVSIFFGL